MSQVENKHDDWIRGGWIQTYTGLAFYPMSPKVEDIQIVDIAHALSQICRYGGHCSRFYSVAEHSVLLSYAVAPENAFWALMHDASEAYLGDIPRPIKSRLAGYVEAERNLMYVICESFGLEPEEPAEVKEADTRILMDERRQLMSLPPETWSEEYKPLGVTLEFMDCITAERRFLERFLELIAHKYTNK